MFWLSQPIGDILHIISDREAVALYLNQFGVLAPLLLAVIMVLQVIVAAISRHALIVCGSYVYGFLPALSLIHISQPTRPY